MATQRRLVVAVARKTASGTAIERRHDACRAYLQECTPAIARIVLLDGPAVLGDTDWQAAEARLWLNALRDLIADAQRRGQFAPVDIDLAACVISAALTQRATATLRQAATAPDAHLVLSTMLRGFEPPH